MKNIYTNPKLNKGKKPLNIPKGSTLEKEWSKNTWYIGYSFNGEQTKVKGNINRIKDYIEKAKKADELLISIKRELAGGYDPANPDAYLQKETSANITLSKAVDEYLEQAGKYLRKKTVQSYESKLRYLVEAYPTHLLKEITAKHIEQYIYKKIHKGERLVINMEGVKYQTNKIIKWTPPTVKAAKGYFTGFFNWCMKKEKGYITENPCKDVDSRKVRSEAVADERHIPFTQEDLQTIDKYLDVNDRYTAMFCRMIYYTCLRPSEIVSLKLSNIKLTTKTITVPMSGMKNTRKTTHDVITIDVNLLTHFNTLNLHNHPSNHYLFSNDYTNIVGETTVGHNRPYKRFVKALKALKLDGKGYTLYSFKHTSNINRYNSGWTLVQIMKANRHTSITMTEKYIRDITRTTDISELTVPAI